MSIIRKYNGIEISPPSNVVTNDFTTTNITGTVAETILTTVLIPANTFKLYDIIDIESRLRKTNANATATIRLRVNTTEVIAGSTLVATFTSTAVSHTYIPIYRRLTIKNLTTGTETIPGATSRLADINASTLVNSNISIDWTVDQYIIATGQLGNASDIMNLMFVVLKWTDGSL